MKCEPRFMRLYAVTDRAWTGTRSLSEQVEAALKGGATCIQLREKDLDPQLFLEEAREIRKLCQAYRVPFLINDNVEIALACQADGVHVGQEDMAAAEARAKLGPDKIIGVSVHTAEEARKAVEDGADYLGAGAVFPTGTKSDAEPMSQNTLREICQAVDIPVVAIGGLNASNILSLKGTGADGVALVSAIFGAEEIETACQQLLGLSEEMVTG